jgi:hypothetical protein
MLNTCTFLIDDFQDMRHSADSPLSECVFACIIKDASSFEKYTIQSFHNLQLTGNTTIFSFYLDLQTTEVCNTFCEWISKNEKMLFRYFFHPNFKIEANMPLLFINGEIRENKNLMSTLSYLNEKTIEQGFDGLCCIVLNEDTSGSKNGHLVFNADTLGIPLATYYLRLLSEEYYVARYIGMYSTDFEKHLDDLKNTEKILQRQDPAIYRLLSRNKELEKSTVILTEELKHIQLQFQNQKTYLRLLTEQDEANKINEFYHHEYEILPLWYKRIGQVIKVCMGKRTFRSLFDNNVKKYKE